MTGQGDSFNGATGSSNEIPNTYTGPRRSDLHPYYQAVRAPPPEPLSSGQTTQVTLRNGSIYFDKTCLGNLNGRIHLDKTCLGNLNLDKPCFGSLNGSSYLYKPCLGNLNKSIHLDKSCLGNLNGSFYLDNPFPGNLN